MATPPANRAGRRAAKKTTPKKVSPLKPSLEKRVGDLEAQVDKMRKVLAQVIAQQTTPAIQQQLQQRIEQELG